LLPKPRLTWTAKAKQSQRSSSVPSFLPPVVLDHSKVFFPSFLSFLFSLFFCQMTDSYVSSRAGDLSPNSNGSALNGSSPSLSNNLHAINPIIRKKLMGYVGFANLPNQVHRKSVRKGFQFTVMVVGASYHNTDFAPRSPLLTPLSSGESGLGKSTLVNTLFNTTLYPPKEPPAPNAERPQTVAIQSISAGNHSLSSSMVDTPP
jgi:septin 7